MIQQQNMIALPLFLRGIVANATQLTSPLDKTFTSPLFRFLVESRRTVLLGDGEQTQDDGQEEFL